MEIHFKNLNNIVGNMGRVLHWLKQRKRTPCDIWSIDSLGPILNDGHKVGKGYCLCNESKVFKNKLACKDNWGALNDDFKLIYDYKDRIGHNEEY